MIPRIASFLASGTEIAHVLGLGDAVVAISHECDYPPELLDRPRLSRPRFDPAGLDSGAIDRAVRSAMLEHGSVYEVDADLLERIRPDLVLTQAVCEVCAVPTPGVVDLVRARRLEARVESLDAHTIDEILGSILQVGAAAGVPDTAARIVAGLRQRLEAVREVVRGGTPPRVLAIEWLDPPFLPGHWVPEMIELAGGLNLVGEPGRHSTEGRWEQLEGLDPDVLLIMPCGFDLDASESDADRHATRLCSVARRAIEAGRSFVVDGSAYMNRSGPRVVDGVELLAGLLHPERVPLPAPDRARVWRSPEPSGDS
jgi:iron complex transport system substrate-binding protein